MARNNRSASLDQISKRNSKTFTKISIAQKVPDFTDLEQEPKTYSENFHDDR